MRDIFNTLPPLLSTVQNQTMGKAAPAPTNWKPPSSQSNGFIKIYLWTF
jgi:hypothetical protein